MSAFLNRIWLEKVDVVPEERKWILRLSSSCPVPDQVLHNLAELLEEQLDHGIQVDIQIKLSPDIGLEQLCEDYWEEIIREIHDKVPSLKVWLNASIRYEVIENRLTFFVANQMALEYCRMKQESIEDCFSQKYGLDTKIAWEIEDEPSEEATFFDCEKEEQRYLEEIFAQKPAVEKKETKQSCILLGKEIKAATHRIADIIDEEKQVIVEGEICEAEIRVLKSGRQLLSFGMTDKTNSISCKLFFDEGQTPMELNVGENVRVRGPVQFDRYTTELTLMPRDLMRIPKIIRPDDAEEKRVELHLHTKLSEMDGVSTVQNIIKRAGEWGHPAIAITDHGVVQAFPDAAEAGKKYGVKVILGMEGYLVDDEGKNAGEINRSKSCHIVLLAKNYTGLKNLYKLVTLSHMEYFHRRPRIPRSLLVKHREGLILGTACESGELMRAIIQKQDASTLEKIASFYDYLEIQPIGNNYFLINSGEAKNEDELKNFNRTIVELGRKLAIPVAATCDVHFLDREDEVYRRILMAGKGFADADNQAPLYFRTTREMLDEFSYLDEADAYQAVVTVPRMIADQIEELKPFPDELYEPKIEGAPEKIRDMSVAKAHELYGDPLPEIVQKTLKKELDSIIGNGFSVLYLIAHLLVKRSNEDGYLVGSRGSVGSSLVATFTGITEVNPLPPHYRCTNPECRYSEFVTDGSVGSGVDLPDKLCPKCGQELFKDGHDIPFETFLGFKGDKVPDIDLNFSGEYQPRAMKYTEEIFGKENVFRAGTIATVAEKTAYGFVKNYLEERKQKFNQTELNRLVKGCSGVKRTTGQHPGGLMVIPKECDVFDFTPLQRPANDTSSDIITTHFDYHSISGRLVKLDLLGHDDPTSIKMLEDLTGVDAKKIRLDDRRTLSLFSSTDALGVTSEEIGSNTGTLGIPEFGTKFVRQMLEDTKPSSFSHLVRISGLSHGTNVWVGNAQDLVLEGTADISNIIACRDDIMIYLIQKDLDPSHAFKIMEQVRKGKGLKPEDIEAMKAKHVPDWYIDSCQKISYMFPKAHAAAYVTMAYRIAWFKINYPEAFYATFYTVRADEFDAELICAGVEKCREMIKEIAGKGNSATAKDKNLQTILELAVEMYCRGIKLRKVDLWESDADQFLITPDGLLPPLSSLQGVGDTAAGVLAKIRDQGGIKSIEDLQAKSQGKISKTVIEALQKHGCLDGIPEKNQLSLF
ncbi:PolC-type DNA polymerase III [Dehalobacter sp. DCM]|uniref:PolC-type DNA polymerase III n=1 Tax=Dehalobacter sp. DCM TaxID=2907827 RepID=UPI003FCE9F9B